MNDFTFVIQADESSALELQLGRYIPTAAPQIAALTGPQGANLVLSGPASGPATPPSFRQIVTADLNGVTLPIANGGTGATSQAAALSALLGASLIPVANGGTNASTASGARFNLGAAASGANSDITSLSGLTTALSISQGGTGAKTQAAALSALLGASLIPIANGGTNASTAAGARSSLGAAASGANSDITSLSGLSTALSIAQGGTGATSTSSALSNLGAQPTNNPTFTGNVGVPTRTTGDSTANAASTAFVAAAIAPMIGKNRLINGNFSINQRAVSGTVSLSAGAYGHDRWKAGASGCTYTFAASGNDTVITITAGSLMQVIEGVNIEGGVYALSNEGSAQARIAINGASTSGAYAAATKSAPLLSSSATGGQQITVEFSTGTVHRAQAEPGTIATPFERRMSLELALCQRYYAFGSFGLGRADTTSQINWSVTWPVRMRATPTITVTKAAHNVAQFGVGTQTSSGSTVSGSFPSLQQSVVLITGYSGLTVGNIVGMNDVDVVSGNAEL